jgi:ferric-dicitrate binding protein FerR (iron transport regulator)
VKQSSRIFCRAAFIGVVCTLIIVISTGCTETQVAPASVGTVKHLKSGTLERQDGNAVWNHLTQNSAIRAGDRLRTGPDSVAVLTLTHVGVVLMKSNTEYTVGSDPMNFNTVLHRGYIWIKTTLARGAKLDISTSDVVAGVRGTRVSVLSDEQGVDICTCTGEVTVTPKNGKHMSVNSGMYDSIGKDGIAEAPKHSKPLLEKLWKGEQSRYTPCRDCHQKGKRGKANL